MTQSKPIEIERYNPNTVTIHCDLYDPNHNIVRAAVHTAEKVRVGVYTKDFKLVARRLHYENSTVLSTIAP